MTATLANIRASAYSKLNRYEAEVSAVLPPSRENVITLVESAWTAFQNAQESLVGAALTDAERKAHDELEEKAEHVYRRIKAILNVGSSQVDSAPRTATRLFNPLPLAPITLPKFEGDPLKWLEFKALFTELVHKQDVDPIHKLATLRQHVRGERVALVNGSYTGGYEETWEALCARFDDPRLLTQTHVERLLKLPTATDTQEGLRKLVDEVTNIMLAFRAMDLQVDHWDPLTVNIVLPKVPATVRTAWIDSSPYDAIPKLDDLLRFIEIRSKNHVPSSVTGARPTRVRVNLVTGGGSSESSDPAPRCACDRNHDLFRNCDVFLGQTAAERRATIQRLKRCFKCFGRHLVNACRMRIRPCSSCSGQHNRLLCDRGGATTQSPSTPTTSN